MGRTGKTLSVSQIVEINRRMIREFGGVFFEGDSNLANSGSLEHILDAVEGTLFGEPLYTDIYQQAAAIAWRIIVGHIFHDGNKRTGMEACRLYLDLSGYVMHMDREVIDVALQIAKREIEFEAFIEWLAERTSERTE
ncbi:type II toxin-antitoxin system death-on-curing family toxin [Aggregatilinea lenta]|uniref:type II toxin-antitoxin system death-on-curing family toxin n=1 Tax=Aggregatilinea lenta TaxID=913108 RepID=UPI000E5A2E7F|nr:type II toxin-antitoxin system death-on-curing family toxin [Aggregatilinea lenta]